MGPCKSGEPAHAETARAYYAHQAGEPDSSAKIAGTRPGDLVASQHRGLLHRSQALLSAIREQDEAKVEAAVVQLSGQRRLYAPLGMVVGAFAMLFEGLRTLLANWRLTLVQILPAMWIWVALLDVKLHLFHGKAFHRLEGWELFAAIAGAGLATAASFYLNAVFAFAISRQGPAQIRPAFAQARHHLVHIVAIGGSIGLLLGVSAFYVDRLGKGWFTVSMSIVIGIMMFAYVAVPSRLIGIKATFSRADRVKASMMGGAIGAVVCSPPYALGRVGILMLGIHVLFIPGIFLLAMGASLQVGATSAVKAVKMSSKLIAHPSADSLSV